MARRKRKKQPSIARRLVVAARWPVILCATLAIGGLFVYVKRVVPISASGFVACGIVQGTVITFSDGSQEFLRPNDARLPNLLDAIPDNHQGVLQAMPAACLAKQQVY